jgi:hypothetical protein
VCPVEEVGIGGGVLQGVGCSRVDGHEAVGLRIRQRVQQDTVDDREDGCIDADAQAERRDGDEREARILDQLPERVLQILPHGLRPRERSHLAMDLLHLRDPAEVARRSGSRLLA